MTQPPMRILIADDTDAIRILAKKLHFPSFFRQTKYEVTEATNGLEAEAALNAGGIDFALLDVNMGLGKTGLELAVMSMALPQGPKILVWSTDIYPLAPVMAQHGLVVVDSRSELSQYESQLQEGKAIPFGKIAENQQMIMRQRVVVASKYISPGELTALAGYLLNLGPS